MKKYIVRLDTEERRQLEQLVSKGHAAAYRRIHAHILLLADQAEGAPARTDTDIAEIVGRTKRTVEHVRQRLVEQGLTAALERKKRDTPPVPAMIDGEKEARLIALACSPPPEGHARWSLRLLADRLVELQVFDAISHKTVGKALKKRVAAPSQSILVHSAGTKRRLRRRHGTGARPVPATV